MVVFDKLTSIIDNGGSIQFAYCNFLKAFDKVPHKQLLCKIKSYGIGRWILKWMKAFLSDRMQQVILNEKPSQRRKWPVASHRLVYWDHCCSVHQCFTWKSAAWHFSFHGFFRIIQEADDPTILQDDISRMLHWTDYWLLDFHQSKCVSLSINNKNWDHRVYNMRYVTQQQMQNDRDIGVIVEIKQGLKIICMQRSIKPINGI